MNLRFDTGDWQNMTFGTHVSHISDRVIPTPEDSPIYIGLENMESDYSEVRSWGTEIEMIGTKLLMEKGDILLARRNPYLRRVQRSPHAGIFSAHGMVLRSNSEDLSQEFLLRFMQSEKFWNGIDRIAVGSLSKTINWGDLLKYEFIAPAINLQLEIADFFLKIENLLTALNNQLKNAELLEELIVNELFLNHSTHSIGEFYELITARTNGADLPDQVKFLGLESISSKTGEYQESIPPLKYKSQVIEFRCGDVLYGKLRPNLRKVMVAPFDGYCSTEILVLRPKVVSAEILAAILRCDELYFRITQSKSGTVMPRVHERDLSRILIADLASNSTADVRIQLEVIGVFMTDIRTEISLCKRLMRSSLREVFK